MNAKMRNWVVGTLAGVVGAAALAGFLAVVKPADPAVPSLRQQVLAAKIAAIRDAREAAPSVTSTKSPVAAAATALPRPGVAQTLGAVAASIAGVIGLVLVGVSISKRYGASQRLAGSTHEALRAQLLERAARADKQSAPHAVEPEPAAVESLTELRLKLRVARREHLRHSRQLASRSVA